MQISTIGFDLAKNVFQVHGVDNVGNVVVARKLRRGQVIAFFAKLSPCLVGMEACASAHHWAREIARLGHEVRLLPPAYVKPYVRRSKNDAADAAAICEAVTRPSMRFVPVKTIDQQSMLMVHRTRDLLIRQRTAAINALRAHLSELGLIAARGNEGAARLMSLVRDGAPQLPALARDALLSLVAQLDAISSQISILDRQLRAQLKASKTCRLLETIPGIGVIGATALAAKITDPDAFRSGRDLAAWIGLVPRQHSSGGKERFGRISKQGDRDLRRILVVGASAVLRHARAHPEKHPWLMRLLARRPAKVAIIALANKMARIAWALLKSGEPYRAPVHVAAA